MAIRIGELRDSSMIATRVGSIRHVVCASPGYLESRGRPITPPDLTGHDCITIDGAASPGGWTFADGAAEVVVPVTSRIDVSSSEAAILAAMAGVGIARVMSYKMQEALRASQLEIVLSDFEPAPWPVNILYTPRHLVPLKIRTFIEDGATATGTARPIRRRSIRREQVEIRPRQKPA